MREVVADPDLKADLERMLVHGEFMDMEVLPVTTMDEALPTILKLYG